MGHAYTPGLKVTDNTTIVKERKLPLKGEILVEKGSSVRLNGRRVNGQRVRLAAVE